MSSNVTKLLDFLETKVASEIETNIYGQSRVLAASTETPMGLGGKKFPVLGNVKAGIVDGLRPPENI